jgi:small GTP-binding protein
LSQLRELLDKCTREELEPLAAHLRLPSEKLGLKDMSLAIDQKLRRSGGHLVANLARAEGPRWKDIVADIARELRVDPEGDIEDVEARIVRAQLERSWDDLDEHLRKRLWLQFGDPTSLPPEGEQFAIEVQQQLGSQFTFKTAAAMALKVAGGGFGALLARPLVPFFLIGGIVKLTGPKMESLIPAALHIASLRLQVRHRITVGFVGSPSSGKDAAIKALFGLDTGNVSPIAGSTKEVAVLEVEDATALFIVNTPGMGDVVESVTEEARQVLAHIDVFIYVLNAEGGVQRRELMDYGYCLKSGKPTMVCLNKMDLIRPKDQERYVEDARRKLHSPREMRECAFDPHPRIFPEPKGVTEVQQWLEQTLVKLGKDPSELPWVTK